MRLKKLLQDLPITLFRGSKELEINGICSHSRRVAPGDLFIAKMGSMDDGSKYIDEALAAGAAAILTDLPDPSLKTAQAITKNVCAMEAEIARRFYRDPSKELFCVGITGTNGKTTTAHLVRHLLGGGMIGTIEYVIGDLRMPAELTTPDVITNQKLLREMVKQGCKSAVMEVSSHGLQQGRVAGIDFDVAIFTNLSRDHLDYHGSMEAYADAKAKLFEGLSEKALAIVPHGETRMIRDCRAKIVTYGIEEGDVAARNVEFFSDHSTFEIDEERYRIPLVGRFNLLNALAALAVKRGDLSTMPLVRGRLEKVTDNIFVDFAHTPDALEKMLTSVREFAPKRVLIVFGAGGDRDRSKRPEMGVVASKHADLVILTSDNPRSEDALAICQEIGCSGAIIETDRRKAIAKALALREEGDILVVAGKGHERSQIFAHKTLPFDDRKVIEELLEEVQCL